MDDGIRRYFAERRARVACFAERHFSLRGSLELHRAALGWDVLRAPGNLLLAGPHVGIKLAGAAAGRLGAQQLARRLGTRNLLLRTSVSRRIEWLVFTELLELPLQQDGHVFRRDALAETILDDPHLSSTAAEMLAAIGPHGGNATFRRRLAEAMASYGATRAAAAEITASLLSLSTGALALKQLTPGAITLGPALAAMLAQQAAVAGFPLGAGLGALWYAMFPAAPSVMLVASVTGGLMLAAACMAAFAGVLADPLQRRLGLHERRLRRALDALEHQMLDPNAPAFVVHDHYVARLLDLVDMLSCAYRVARG